MRFGKYCICGAVMKGEILPDSKAMQVLAIWEQVHSGEGHKPCDSATASKNRNKEEDKIIKLNNDPRK